MADAVCHDIPEKAALSSSKVSVVEMEEGLPQYTRPEKIKKQQWWRRFGSVCRRSIHRHNKEEESPWPKLMRRLLYMFGATLILFGIAAIVYHILLINLVRRLSPPKVKNTGLSEIVKTWKEPGINPNQPFWLPNFSKDIVPKAIHSHNDYWRSVPLYEALSLGITGIEADCHLINNELYVGHTNSSLRPHLTLRSLYLDPLLTILEHQNAQSDLAPSSKFNGVWDTAPQRSIVLMTDLKTEGASTLEAVQAQLEPFREKGWLTHWNGTDVVPGPIIHVGTGNTPFSSILSSPYSNSSYRDVFFDAPLHALTAEYNISNTYYTSTSLTHMFGGAKHISQNGLNKEQLGKVREQVGEAEKRGLVSRYWDIPGWPVDRRTRIWGQLEQVGVGMLNVDAIGTAARWNWRWCNVLGLHLC